MKKSFKRVKNVSAESAPVYSYKEAFDYIYESRKYTYIVLLIFLISGVYGFVFADNLAFINEIVKELVEKTAGLSGVGMTLFIFFNNLQTSFIGMLGGILLGIFPILASLFNGIIVGYVIERSWELTGFYELWRLLPHGIFELPAIFISLGLGMKLGMFVFDKNPGKEFTRRIRLSLISFVLVILPLLVVAAIIEGVLIHLGKS